MSSYQKKNGACRLEVPLFDLRETSQSQPAVRGLSFVEPPEVPWFDYLRLCESSGVRGGLVLCTMLEAAVVTVPSPSARKVRLALGDFSIRLPQIEGDASSVTSSVPI